jgi:hypothetical protein
MQKIREGLGQKIREFFAYKVRQIEKTAEMVTCRELYGS